MNTIFDSEFLLILVMIVHVILTPLTKVEESFNIQAIHDILYVRSDITKYDHHEFPGVVPRTFIGPLALSAILMPIVSVFNYLNKEKYWMLLAARIVLGLGVVVSFCNFCRCCEKRFDHLTGTFLRLIVASQFHFLFYASRTLPNIFALVLVLWAFQTILNREFYKAVVLATISSLIFRFELILLFGPIFLIVFARKQFSIFKAILTGLITTVLILGITFPLDSFFWQRWIWPEGEVIKFNLILNRSNEYGVSPFFWYFFSVLPRALAASIILIPFGFFLERKALLPIVGPAVSFIIIYSFLPHKELRFIIYAFPLLNLPAAIFCAKMWKSRDRSKLQKILAWGTASHLIANLLLTMVLAYCSSINYPGGDALIIHNGLITINRLQFTLIIFVHKTALIDFFIFTTNGSNFLRAKLIILRYNKTENLPLGEYKRFDYIMVGFQEFRKQKNKTKFAKTHSEYYKVDGFHRISFKRSSEFPFYWPIVHLKTKVMVLKRKE